MVDLRMRQVDAQPIGWISRRTNVRQMGGGQWQQIEMDFDPEAREALRLSTLQELEIDLLTRDELYDYLSWLAEELEIDISDMYRMYLGYDVAQAQAAE